MAVLKEHAHNGPFITKALRKENMQRTKLRNRYNDHRTEENLKAYKKQRNKCVKLLCKANFDYYGNMDLGDLTDSHKFWKTVRPLFSDKVQVNSSVTLLEEGIMVSKDSEMQRF